MKELARDKRRLEDIVEYSQNVLKIIDGVEFEEFSQNILIYFATMKNIEIVGEAAYMLTKDFKANHKGIPKGTAFFHISHYHTQLFFFFLLEVTRKKRNFAA